MFFQKPLHHKVRHQTGQGSGKPPRSLRWRLLSGLLPLALGFMLVAWWVHGRLLDTMAEDFLSQRLQQEAQYLLQEIARSQDQATPRLSQLENFDQIFHHAYLIQIGEDRYASTQAQPQLDLAPWLEGPDDTLLSVHQGGRLLMLYRRVIPAEKSAAPVRLVVAEDYANLNQSIHALHWWVAMTSLLLMALLVALILGLVALALRPLDRLKAQLDQLPAASPAHLDDEGPAEFRPLIQQINRLLDQQALRLKRSREQLANLSHSLKTPLAALLQRLRQPARLTQDEQQEMLVRLDQLVHQLDGELRRSHLAGPDSGHQAHPVVQARKMVRLLGQLHPDKRLLLETPLDDLLHWPIDGHDLDELLGNLLDNAGKWARQTALLSCRIHTDTDQRRYLQIQVADDGPGVEEQRIDQLGQRGLRLDSQTQGHGIGLALVREITTRYGGRLTLTRADAGGLQVTVDLPE